MWDTFAILQAPWFYLGAHPSRLKNAAKTTRHCWGVIHSVCFLARSSSSAPGRGSGVPSQREGVQGPHALHRVHPEGSRTLRHGQDHPATLIQTRVQRRRRHEVHRLQPVHQQNDEQVRGGEICQIWYKVSIYGQEKKVRYYGLRGWDWPFWVGFVCMYLTL